MTGAEQKRSRQKVEVYFRYNAWYPAEKSPVIDPGEYRLQLAGMIADRKPWTVEQLRALPQTSQITRHVCVEGWSMIGKWTGAPLSTFLQRVGADLTAKYVGFECADGYYEGIDMPTALHPQTQLTTMYAGERLNKLTGFPIRLKTPTKLGFKQPKQITAIEVTRTNPGGYWENRGFNWFSGL